MRLRGHKQKKWINKFIQFSFFVSSRHRCQAEFWYIENGQFLVQVNIPNMVPNGFVLCPQLLKGWITLAIG